MSGFVGINKATFSDPVNRRLVGGLLLSVLIHALVLSMQFGIPGLGMPGLELPWKERRASLQPMTIQIANTQQAAAPEKLIQAILPSVQPLDIPVPEIPRLKTTLPIIESKGIRVVDAVVLSKPPPVSKKLITAKQKTNPAPPTRLARPAVDLPDTPTRVIAQDQLRDDSFVVAVPDPEESVHKSTGEKSAKENAKVTVAETFDQTALSDVELAKSVELAIAKEVERENAEKAETEKVLQQTRKLAEQQAEKQVEQNKRELELALAAQAIEKQIQAKKLEEAQQKQLVVKQLEDATKQQEIAIALQKKLDAEEQVKRLQKQELVRLETQKKQDEQRKEQQLAQEVETRKRIEIEEKQQISMRQKQLDEQIQKQKTEQLATRLKTEELAARKAAEQKLAEQKLAEQKLAEQKLAEQKLAEQKLAEQKLAEQKLAEQKLAEQKLAEQKLAEQKLAEQKLAEQRLAEQKLAEQKLAEQKLAEQKLAEQKLAEQRLAEQRLAEQRLAEQRLAEQRLAEQRAVAQRERALADAAAASKANVAGLSTNANANGSAGAGAGGTNFVLPKNNFSSDLANRAREQSRGLDVLSGTPPTPRQAGPDLNSRRRSILGSFDREVPLRMYVESWRQKIERNGNFNYSQTAKDKARGDPVVIVAIRSDGSVEDVTIVRSSGRADLDEAVGRIVRLNAPYSVFPQNIAAKYDVIEIRRVWRFDETLRIIEEIR